METRLEIRVANTNRSERLRIVAAAGSQWWKVWVLLTSLAATVLGWMTFTGDAGTGRGGAVSNMQVATPVVPVLTVWPLDAPSRLERNAGTIPAMPQKPVFQAPVTRTRRS